MIIAGFSLFFIGLIFVISYPINRKKNSRCSAETNGTLSEIRKRFDHDGDLKSMHVYSYCVDGTDYILETLDYSPEANDVGDSCTIWYNPSKPNDAQAFRGSVEYLKKLLIIGVVLVLLGIIIICIGLAHL